MISVGDVFRGKPSFEFGRKKANGTVEVADLYQSTYIINEVGSYDPVTGKANYVSTNQLAVDDATRINAEFVVESVTMSGGSDRDCIADEPHVVARRLNDDGSYKPTGELISFVYVAEGKGSNFTTASRVDVIRHMTRVVMFY